MIYVSQRLSVEPLLLIENSEFSHWYSLGVWWAMYGDQQGNGPYEDRYIIDTITRGICNGRYHDLASGWFPMIGFNLGMLHGGMTDPDTRQRRPAATLVALTDPDFTKGYHVGRDYFFTEAPLDGRILSDQLFYEAVHEWAVGFSVWRDAPSVLRYCLGCRIGELSGVLLPLNQAVAHR